MNDNLKNILANCAGCPEWLEHVEDGSEATGYRYPGNCARWLCNSGGCPHDPKNGHHEDI